MNIVELFSQVRPPYIQRAVRYTRVSSCSVYSMYFLPSRPRDPAHTILRYSYSPTGAHTFAARMQAFSMPPAALTCIHAHPCTQEFPVLHAPRIRAHACAQVFPKLHHSLTHAHPCTHRCPPCLPSSHACTFMQAEVSRADLSATHAHPCTPMHIHACRSSPC